MAVKDFSLNEKQAKMLIFSNFCDADSGQQKWVFKNLGFYKQILKISKVQILGIFRKKP